MKTEHLFTSDEKLKLWGYGEWVEEPDQITFEHKGIECKVLRMAQKEPHAEEFHMFGGFLNGYVRIPKDHHFFGKEYDDIDLDCHCGLTFGEFDLDCGWHWIGFDCNHYYDVCPSTEHFKNKSPILIESEKRLKKLIEERGMIDHVLFQKSYKNVDFCIRECKSMADQLKVYQLMQEKEGEIPSL